MKELQFITEFEKFITASASGKRLTATGKKLTKGAIENYGYTLLLLKEYETLYQIKLRIALLNKASLKTIQKEKNYWLKFYRQFASFLYKQKSCFDNYVATTFKNIKTFFNYLLLEKALPVGQYHKLFKTPQKQFTPIVLAPEQLNFLITNQEFYNSLTPSLQRIRDIFIIGCTVGLRVSDLMRLKKTNIITTQNETYLKIHTQKTGTEIKIPLPEYAVEILRKYAKKNNSYVLPQLANVNINKHLKQLAEKAGWTHNLPKSMSKQGKIVEVKTTKGKSYRFCDHITSHTMRRTAITTLLILGVPELVVRKLSGHAAGSKEFYKYISIANDYTNQQLKQAHHKLFNFSIEKNANIEVQNV